MAERSAGMPGMPGMVVQDWRQDLPVLTSRLVALREPAPDDLGALADVLSTADASHFGVDEPLTEDSVRAFIERVRRDRAAGISLTYAVVLVATRAIVGLVQVRQLDPSFEAAEWDMTLVPSVRGTGVFLDAARLAGSFVFSSLNTYRLESRVIVQHGRANGALRKIGAVQEGVLRRSVRRGGEYFDQALWSVLKDDWGDHWVSTASRVH